jgi:hypothetical protein
MDRQAYGLLLTFHHGLARRLIGTNGHQSDLSWWSLDTVLIDERKVDFPDDLEDRLGLERRAVQSVLDLGEEPGIQGLGIQPPEDLSLSVSYAH